MKLFAAVVALALPLICLHSLANAQATTPEFGLELNNAVSEGDNGCRLTYVAVNRSDRPLNHASFEVAVFDAQGVVNRLLVLEFGALTANKTKVVQFDIGQMTCDNISRIVVNDLSECTLSDGSEGTFCLTGLETSYRGDIQFSP